MATLEKPKKNKSKKQKPKPKGVAPVQLDTDEEEDEAEGNNIKEELKNQIENLSINEEIIDHVAEEEEEGVQNPHSSTANIKNIATIVEASAAATIDNIVTRECFIASDYTNETRDNKENVANDEIVSEANEGKEICDETTATTQSSNEQDHIVTEPTAPPALISSSPQTSTFPHDLIQPSTSNIVQYPQIQTLRHEESITEVVYKPPKIRSPGFRLSASKLEAFSLDQLKQYYHCPELTMVQQFEMEFLTNSLLETHEQDPLYVALQEYYHMQSKLTMNLHDVKKFRKEAVAAQEHIWVEVPITKTFSEKCGDKVEVRETVTYNIVQVDGKNLEAATSSLTVLFDIISNTYTSNLITTKIIKIKIDQMIDEIMLFPHKTHEYLLEGPLRLQQQLDSHLLQIISQIRRALGILFHFSRKLSPNKDFAEDLKSWFQKLISLHLRLATKEDHWFLLFNILRCPSGIGGWASEYVQIPCNTKDMTAIASTPTAHTNEVPLQLNSPEISHCMSVLQVLLMPIKKRNEYLKQFTQSQKEITDPAKEERWILIDSDGEDSHTASGDCVGLKESDLIALLNQIPFEQLFRSALKIEKFLDDYIIEGDLISAQQMLKVLSFFSQLITVFGDGMLTYSTERYKQLAKRLGRLMRHSLQYVSDYYEMFRQNNLSKDVAVCERIALENNALLLKACSYIYRTRNLATWQYFSSLPFPSMEADIVWQIFYYLNVGFPTEFSLPEEDYMDYFSASDFWAKFNVANADSSDEDLYYLLQAFFEMANDRDKNKDWDLIKTICMHIFNIGYLNHDTRDICYKTARDMLVNLTLAYEDLLSCLLTQLKIRFNDCENVVYLFKSLPLENWKPSMESFEILSNWLLHFDFRSRENMLARIIISHLNWSFDCDGRLFLPHNIHVRMACLIAEALTKHAPEVLGLSGISESVRQVSSLIDFSQSTKEQFTTWCWSIVSLLRLHIMDQNVETIKSCLRNPSEGLMFVPELERVDLIYQGVNENRPLALYVAILVSLHGHSIPIICQKGFDLMQRLLSDHRHAAVIRCLELIVPLFLETPDTLGNAEKFHGILNTLLNADKTYLKMAKDMVYPNSVGPVLELLDNMIHHQITSYTNYGLTSPLNLINVWLNSLTALPNWQNTYVVYLLDKILRVAYQFPDAHLQCVEFFNNYYKDCNEWKGANKMSSLKGFFGGNQTKIPILSAYQPWLALVLLEIEFKTQDSFIWSELLRQLSSAGSNNNLDAILKKTLTIAKRPVFPANMLVIYKYANLVANMDINHALFPIVNQKFFELFLSRVPTNYDEHSFQQTYGVSDKFYEYNVPLMKKIKTQLKAAETFYDNEAKTHANDESFSYYYRNCNRIMKTYALWLEDTAINKMSKDQESYQPQYNGEKLKEIFNGPTHHWTEFLYLPLIRKEQRYQADQWARKCFRFRAIKQLRTPLQSKPKSTPIQRIKSHLSSYDKQLPPPKYMKPDKRIVQEITTDTLKELKDKLKILTNTATKFHFKTSELNSINRNYMENIVQLYKMVPYEEIKIKNCNSLVFNRRCSNPARIVTILEKIRKDEQIQQKIDAFRERHDKIIDEMLHENVEEFARSVGDIGQIIRLLLQQANATPHDADDRLKCNTGIAFFYHVIENMSEITMKFNATNKFYSELLNDLGVFIQANQEDEGLKILELALKRPNLLKSLAGVFVPCQTRPPYFLKMYKFLIDSHLKLCDTKILFVLFSKFDLILWLENFTPKLYDINQLLQLVLQGLESWSQPSSSLLQDQFRRHLVHIFDCDFPEHYGEVMQMVLDGISDNKLMPIVLLDLLNSLLVKFNCVQMHLDTPQHMIQAISMDFARRQTLFNLKAATDTVMLFARHFQKERLSHGLHGLYPKHKDYCGPLAMWFACMGHCVVVSAICTYQELLADQICDLIFGSIIEMYSPWLITYTEDTIRQSSANWIRQLVESGNGKRLFPWSEQHAKTSKIMIKNFVQTLMFIMENLPISHKILSHCFSWYIHHFAVPNIENYIYGPIHEGIAELPWENFQPQHECIDMLYDTLQKFLPHSHAMLGHIFIRINWNQWFENTLPTIPGAAHKSLVSRLFTIFVKIAFEPNIHIQINTSKVLEDAIKYPWYMVDYGELENLLKWFCTSVEPTIILRIPEESNYVDRAVLDLLRLTCAMMPEIGNDMQQISNATAKRILYTRSMIRLQRQAATKNPKLLATKEGKKVFNNAFEELLQTLNQSLVALANTKSREEQRREALNVMLEIILPMQTQSEETSNLHIESIIKWQATTAEPGNILMCSVLSALGHMKAFIGGAYTLLESTIIFYFRSSETSLEWHTPCWVQLLQILQMSLEKLELMPIMRNSSIFTLHIFILYKMEKMPTVGDQITFMQDLCQLIESIKTEPATEAMMAVVWGAMISWGCRIFLSEPQNAKKPLIMLSRHLQHLSTQSEGWGDGLLGAIGLKKDIVTNKRKVLTRCLAIVILSIYPELRHSINRVEPNEEYSSSMRELAMLLANKKFLDVKPLVVQAIGILEENAMPKIQDVPHLVCRLISLFYCNGFLTTVPEVWQLDFHI